MMDGHEALLEPILEKVALFKEQIASNKEILLANLVMAGEIPAETFKEEKRRNFMLDRFRESGLDFISTDEVDNAYAVVRGRTERNILVSAHVDTLFQETEDHTVRVERDKVTGAGVADNSLGVAVITSLPNLFDAMNLKFNSNIILMGASRSLGKGNIEGIRFFLDHYSYPIAAGLFVEGVELGRLSYNSLGTLRGELRISTGDSEIINGSLHHGAIDTLSELISKIRSIPIPQKPRTEITLGSCYSGKAFNIAAKDALLRFEINSEEIGMVTKLKAQIHEIISELSSESGLKIEFKEIARRRPGGIGFSHALTTAARSVMSKLEVQHKVKPSMGELSALIDKSIPGLTLGITQKAQSDEGKESVYIEPMFTGIAQLIAIISAIDEGIMDERED